MLLMEIPQRDKVLYVSNQLGIAGGSRVLDELIDAILADDQIIFDRFADYVRVAARFFDVCF